MTSIRRESNILSGNILSNIELFNWPKVWTKHSIVRKGGSHENTILW